MVTESMKWSCDSFQYFQMPFLLGFHDQFQICWWPCILSGGKIEQTRKTCRKIWNTNKDLCLKEPCTSEKKKKIVIGGMKSVLLIRQDIIQYSWYICWHMHKEKWNPLFFIIAYYIVRFYHLFYKSNNCIFFFSYLFPNNFYVFDLLERSNDLVQNSNSKFISNHTNHLSSILIYLLENSKYERALEHFTEKSIKCLN